MKAPAASNVRQIRPQPMTAPREPIPPQYYQMAAAHMLSLGKQVFENQSLLSQAAPNGPQGQ